MIGLPRKHHPPTEEYIVDKKRVQRLAIITAALALLVGSLAGFFIVSALTAPAHAAVCADGACTILEHGADSGYDAPITVKCADGHAVNVPEGAASNAPGGCQDVKQVYIHSNPIEQIRCFRMDGWYTQANTPGWHNVNNWQGYRTCVNQIRSDQV
jgi:hypothetical protein